MKTIVIAEAGVNHNGDLEIAKKLIDVAVEAKADFVKFQTFKAEKLAIKGLEKAAYQKVTTESQENQWDMLKRLELQAEHHRPLLEHCQRQGIGFMSTPFDIESANFLHELGMKIFKIPSGEITNLPFLRAIARFQKPVIMSSGMSDITEVKSAVEVFKRENFPLEMLTVLHCTSQYPAPMEELNLLAIPEMSAQLGVSVGYSDHSAGIVASVVAVGLGARVIEKHFTLSRQLPGPDHQASLEPAELQAMIRDIRLAEKARGQALKQVVGSEKANRELIRKSMVAARMIKKGEIFTAENVTTKRPGTGISPMRWDQVIGQPARRDYNSDELIQQCEVE